MSAGSNPRITAYVDNPCYECDRSYSSPTVLIRHMKEKHNLTLESRKSNINRPASVKWKFVSRDKPHRRTLYGCPSCWFHCNQDNKRLKKHITEIHLDETNELNKEDPDDKFEDSDDEENDYHQDEVSVRSELDYLVKDVKGGIDSLVSLFNRLVFAGAKKGEAQTDVENDEDDEEDELEDGQADYVEKTVVTTRRRTSVATA